MKKKLLFLVLFPIFIFSQTDIVGGDDADISDYPWQVALTEQSGNWTSAFCGGSIIDNYWVLTAAHCVEDGFNGTLYIRAGSDNSYAQGGSSYSVDEIIMHPNYNTNTYNNDIALLKLNNPISFNSNRQPVILICDDQVSMGAQNPGVMATITGWGETETNNYNGTLQFAQVPITTSSNYGWGQIDADMIMAGYPSGGYDTCQGDSGGPMVVRNIDDTEWMLVGITSWGNGCAEPGYPGVYSRVSYFLDWICVNTDGDVCSNENDVCTGSVVYGCTDLEAENYNSNATIDDGSCNYACDQIISLEIIFDCWPEETGWSITNESGNIISSETSGSGPSTIESICLSNGCYTFTITDTYGDGLGGAQWNGCNINGSYEIISNSEFLVSGGGDFGSSTSNDFCIDNTIYGCTNSVACNYNPNATDNDGSCTYPENGYDCNGNCLNDIDNDGICDDDEILGCTNSLACNYNVIATDDDGSCTYPENGYDCNGNCIENITETQNCFCNENETVTYFELYNEDMCIIYQLCECICINDENNNGICDENEFEEIAGCIDQNANNYNSLANTDDGSCIYSQAIELQEGWNIWSTYINPSNTDMLNIFSTINDDLIIVKDDEGNVYWPEYNLNSIGSINIGSGYQTKMSSYNILNLSGSLIPYDYNIFISNGWSIIAYLNQDAYNIEDMMIPIVDNIVIVKDEEGNVYWPEYGLNSIENMNPGKGYQIKMLNPVNLTYPSTQNARFNFQKTEYFSNQKPVNTGNNMILGIPESCWTIKPEINDEIIVYDNTGIIVGIGIYKNEMNAITIWGDDHLTLEKDGLYDSEKFNLRLWKNQNQKMYDLNINNFKQGNDTYSVNGISIAQTIILSETSTKKLIKITDILGREVNTNNNQKVLIYIYDDGSIEKVFNN